MAAMGVRDWPDEDDDPPAEETGWLIAGTLWEGQNRREKLERARRFHEVALADAYAAGDDIAIEAAKATLAVIDKMLSDGPGGRFYARAGRRRRRFKRAQ
jgi:hypothetical protein